MPGGTELLVQFCPEEYMERMESTCPRGFVICRHEELEDELRAGVGRNVRICPLSLNELAMAEHNKKNLVGVQLPPWGRVGGNHLARNTLGKPMRCCQAGEELRESHL